MIRLVVIKNKMTGDFYGFKMVVIPDLNYLTSQGDQIFTNTYLSRDTDLSGLVMFYNIGGEFVNGWQYADGQIISKIEKSDMESASSGMAGLPRLRSTSGYLTIETCYYYIVSTDGGATWSEPRLSGCTQKTYAVFLFDDSDYGGGGGYYPADGGGSTGSTVTSEADAPNAKKILRNSTMTEENWELIENMLLKIIENCLGEGLYNGLVTALNGKTLSIQFNNSGYISSFDASSGTISLDMTGESNRLFHEMWHAYQSYQETLESYNKSKLNREIEAWYAQYLYTQSLTEYTPQSKWYGIYHDTELGGGIREIKKYVDYKGNSLISETQLYSYLAGIETLFREMPEYSEAMYPYDYDRSAISHFANLKRLSANCN